MRADPEANPLSYCHPRAARRRRATCPGQYKCRVEWVSTDDAPLEPVSSCAAPTCGGSMAALEVLLDRISGWVWGPPLLILLFGPHLFLTFRLRFIQRYLGRAIRMSFQRHREGQGDISHFGALT